MYRVALEKHCTNGVFISVAFAPHRDKSPQKKEKGQHDGDLDSIFHVANGKRCSANVCWPSKNEVYIAVFIY